MSVSGMKWYLCVMYGKELFVERGVFVWGK